MHNRKNHEWSSNNLMKIIIEEPEFQDLSLSWKERDIIRSCNDTTLKKTNASKYLGVTLDDNFSWKNHVNEVKINRSEENYSSGKDNTSKMEVLYNTLNIIFNKYIKPIMLCFSEILITVQTGNLKKMCYENYNRSNEISCDRRNGNFILIIKKKIT